ncbi:putative vacuolar protein sorting-associated protein 13A [Symbiodinium microadriaticum]|uniref:Putative vacuolar protein sorting-associated protein 13A n=1 Tax=Symbiodinium microadriaticum TaxID=2951 RepID=A0A1Q9F3H6_SYMMI|nr:putative vacuolar protein sorting-associated protein 13A [Symbiodinium microadriaticum]
MLYIACSVPARAPKAESRAILFVAQAAFPLKDPPCSPSSRRVYGAMRRSSLGKSGALVLLLGLCYLALDALSCFVGAGLTNNRSSSVEMRGYRLDRMLEATDGDRSLQTSEGFWIGEKGFEKSQWAQGYRYRMRASPEEFKKGIDCPAPLQIGPIKWKVGECFGGSGNNDKLRQLKKELAQAGRKRWYPKYVNQSGAKNQQGLLRGLAAWSGYDPLNEERGKTWIEADYGKPLIEGKKDYRLPGLLTKAAHRGDATLGRQLEAFLVLELKRSNSSSGDYLLPFVPLGRRSAISPATVGESAGSSQSNDLNGLLQMHVRRQLSKGVAGTRLVESIAKAVAEIRERERAPVPDAEEEVCPSAALDVETSGSCDPLVSVDMESCRSLYRGVDNNGLVRIDLVEHPDGQQCTWKTVSKAKVAKAKEAKVAMDSIDLTIDDAWLDPLQAGCSNKQSDSETLLAVACDAGFRFADISSVAGQSVLEGYEPPPLPAVIQVDNFFISKVDLTVWCALKLRTVRFLPQWIRTAIRMLSFSGQLTLDGVDLYAMNLLSHMGELLGKSSAASAASYVTDSFSQMTGEAASLLSTLTLDEEHSRGKIIGYIARQRQIRNAKQIESIQDGLAEAGKSLQQGRIDGLADIVREPMRGAEQDGVAGFFTGLGRGLVGSCVKPVSNVGLAIRDVGSGIANTINPDSNATKRRRRRFRARQPRLLFGKLGVVRPWCELEAQLNKQIGELLVYGIEEVIPLTAGPKKQLLLCLYPERMMIVELRQAHG